MFLLTRSVRCRSHGTFSAQQILSCPSTQVQIHAECRPMPTICPRRRIVLSKPFAKRPRCSGAAPALHGALFHDASICCAPCIRGPQQPGPTTCLQSGLSRLGRLGGCRASNAHLRGVLKSYYPREAQTAACQTVLGHSSEMLDMHKPPTN